MSGVRLSSGQGRHVGCKTSPSRRAHSRQDQSRSVRHRSRRRADALRHRPQPVRRQAHRRRLEHRLGACRCRRLHATRARHRYRRIGPGAGGVQQHRRAQAEPRHGVVRRRRSRLPHVGLRVCLRAHRRRCDGNAESDRGSRRCRSLFASAAGRRRRSSARWRKTRRAVAGPAPVLRRHHVGQGLRRGVGAADRSRRKNRRDRHRAVLRGGATALRRAVGGGTLSCHEGADCVFARSLCIR